MNRGYVFTPLAEADLEAAKLRDLTRFYAVPDRLKQGVGRARRLSSSDGRMDWPTRGVYSSFEPGDSPRSG